MKRIPVQIALLLLILSLVAPSFVLAQKPSGVLDGRGPGRRSRAASDPKIQSIQRDFDEALKMIQEQYIDGKRLNYNDVYKSSIIGMLRSLTRPLPPPPPPGEMRKVNMRYRCDVCGVELRLTMAPDEDPPPPRHCLEDMIVVAPIME